MIATTEYWVYLEQDEGAQLSTLDCTPCLVAAVGCVFQVCGLLLAREGPGYPLASHSVGERLLLLYREAGVARCWAALRYASSLLTQLVDGICPNATQVTPRLGVLPPPTDPGQWQEFGGGHHHWGGGGVHQAVHPTGDALCPVLGGGAPRHHRGGIAAGAGAVLWQADPVPARAVHWDPHPQVSRLALTWTQLQPLDSII